MVSSKASTPFWQARTGTGLHPDLLAYSETTKEDLPFVRHDLAGSSAHVLGLVKAGLLSKDEAKQLLSGLRAILANHKTSPLELQVDLEDLHMFIETRLTAELGDIGKRLHSGRSRNDQVATCIVLYAREHIAALAEELHALAGALAQQAAQHTKTPWVARTHGLPAQPATVGFLLAGHAHRVQDLVTKSLASFDQVGESPLGSGAVGGSSLPLDPAYTASLMGLRAPRSAILATGTRDAVVEACLLAHHVGLVVSSLAQDLLNLFIEGQLKLPGGYTTGSSLMPQKRNPDALELARGRSKALAGPLAAVSGILAGLGLGYQRDFQLTKPYLVAAVGDARSTVRLLTPLVQGMAVTPSVPSDWAKPGIVATDVAEALVKAGLPFRSAYTIVAAAFAEVEKGATFRTALEMQKLPTAQLKAALACLLPDPARRATVGGPAPAAVSASLKQFQARQSNLAAAVAEAKEASQVPFALLRQPIASLVKP